MRWNWPKRSLSEAETPGTECEGAVRRAGEGGAASGLGGGGGGGGGGGAAGAWGFGLPLPTPIPERVWEIMFSTSRSVEGRGIARAAGDSAGLDPAAGAGGASLGAGGGGLGGSGERTGPGTATGEGRGSVTAFLPGRM